MIGDAALLPTGGPLRQASLGVGCSLRSGLVAGTLWPMGRLMDWLRGSPEAEPAPGQVVTVDLGTDIHVAHLIADACVARGLRVELLTSEMGAHPQTPGVEQRMLVRSEDLAAVREVLSDQNLR